MLKNWNVNVNINCNYNKNLKNQFNQVHSSNNSKLVLNHMLKRTLSSSLLDLNNSTNLNQTSIGKSNIQRIGSECSIFNIPVCIYILTIRLH